uniref:Uncharacterized protein n=1 Tax=Rhipicephalus pulchellus TaxID=72859 RepID=L7LVN7_RHIPC
MCRLTPSCLCIPFLCIVLGYWHCEGHMSVCIMFTFYCCELYIVLGLYCIHCSMCSVYGVGSLHKYGNIHVPFAVIYMCLH